MLKYILFAIMCTLTFSAIIIAPNVENFDFWKSIFAKSYSAINQEIYRKTIFLNNLKKIYDHNADKKKTYKMGINQFMDLTRDEFKATYLNGLK